MTTINPQSYPLQAASEFSRPSSYQEPIQSAAAKTFTDSQTLSGNLKIERIIERLMPLLDNLEIQKDQELSALLGEKSELLLNLNSQNLASQEDLTFYNRIGQLIDPRGQIRAVIKRQLMPNSSAALILKSNERNEIPSVLGKVEKESYEYNAKGQTVNQKTGYVFAATVAARTSNQQNPNQMFVAHPKNQTALNPIKELVLNADNAGNNDLHRAALVGNLDLCKSLIASGANPSVVNIKNGQTALHMSARAGKLETVQFLVSVCDKKLLDAQTLKGETPLIMATYDGHTQVFKALIDAGANPYVTDRSGSTVLHAAAMLVKIPIVELLVVNKQLIDMQDASGQTALINAAMAASPEICKILLKEGARPYFNDNEGMDALYWACTNELMHEIVSLLVAQHVGLDKRYGKGKETALITCVLRNNVKGCKVLMGGGANPSIADESGYNALHHAIIYNKPELVKILAIDKKILEIPDKIGTKPLKLAEDYPQARKALISAGLPDPDGCCVIS